MCTICYRASLTLHLLLAPRRREVSGAIGERLQEHLPPFPLRPAGPVSQVRVEADDLVAGQAEVEVLQPLLAAPGRSPFPEVLGHPGGDEFPRPLVFPCIAGPANPQLLPVEEGVDP